MFERQVIWDEEREKGYIVFQLAISSLSTLSFQSNTWCLWKRTKETGNNSNNQNSKKEKKKITRKTILMLNIVTK